MKLSFAVISLLASALTILTACGGGSDTEGSYLFDITSYDEYSRPAEKYTPPTNKISFFPLALHFKTITKSYVSKVGTTASREYIISGRMTTPTVTNGAYDSKSTTTLRYQSATLFEGASVTPVLSENRRYEIKLNGVAQPDANSAGTLYYDTTFGLRVGSSGSGVYKVLDQLTALPEITVAGDAGDFLEYKVYSNSTKSNLIGKDILGYRVVSTSLGSAGEFKARVEYIIRSYSSQGLLLSVQTSTDDAVFTLNSEAGSTNVSIYVDDIAGTTTSRLQITRVR
jgi:hypothetical protein